MFDGDKHVHAIPSKHIIIFFVVYALFLFGSAIGVLGYDSLTYEMPEHYQQNIGICMGQDDWKYEKEGWDGLEYYAEAFVPIGAILGLIFRFRVMQDRPLVIDKNITACQSTIVAVLKLINGVITILLPAAFAFTINAYNFAGQVNW